MYTELVYEIILRVFNLKMFYKLQYIIIVTANGVIVVECWMRLHCQGTISLHKLQSTPYTAKLHYKYLWISNDPSGPNPSGPKYTMKSGKKMNILTRTHFLALESHSLKSLWQSWHHHASESLMVKQKSNACLSRALVTWCAKTTKVYFVMITKRYVLEIALVGLWLKFILYFWRCPGWNWWTILRFSRVNLKTILESHFWPPFLRIL